VHLHSVVGEGIVFPSVNMAVFFSKVVSEESRFFLRTFFLLFNSSFLCFRSDVCCVLALIGFNHKAAPSSTVTILLTASLVKTSNNTTVFSKKILKQIKLSVTLLDWLNSFDLV